MKRKLALSFLFVFTMALSAPVMSEAMTQEPAKKECEKKKAECTKEEKKECPKAEKKECTKKAEKKEAK